MTLNDYLKTPKETVEFAQKIGVDRNVVYQWKKHIRHVPIIRCKAIVYASNGKVTYKDLRPHDWHLIWDNELPKEFQEND